VTNTLQIQHFVSVFLLSWCFMPASDSCDMFNPDCPVYSRCAHLVVQHIHQISLQYGVIQHKVTYSNPLTRLLTSCSWPKTNVSIL